MIHITRQVTVAIFFDAVMNIRLSAK